VSLLCVRIREGDRCVGVRVFAQERKHTHKHTHTNTHTHKHTHTQTHTHTRPNLCRLVESGLAPQMPAPIAPMMMMGGGLGPVLNTHTRTHAHTHTHTQHTHTHTP
jgi:hypothetical protein